MRKLAWDFARQVASGSAGSSLMQSFHLSSEWTNHNGFLKPFHLALGFFPRTLQAQGLGEYLGGDHASEKYPYDSAPEVRWGIQDISDGFLN